MSDIKIGDVSALLREPPDSLVEHWSRSMSPSVWRRIDEHIADDDWHGGTAANRRKTILAEDRDALQKLAVAIELWSVLGDEG